MIKITFNQFTLRTVLILILTPLNASATSDNLRDLDARYNKVISLKLGKLDEAIKAYDKAIEIKPLFSRSR